jgi:hypothetical protein
MNLSCRQRRSALVRLGGWNNRARNLIFTAAIKARHRESHALSRASGGGTLIYIKTPFDFLIQLGPSS